MPIQSFLTLWNFSISLIVDLTNKPNEILKFTISFWNINSPTNPPGIFVAFQNNISKFEVQKSLFLKLTK